MSFAAVRCVLNVSRISASTKNLLANSVAKSFPFGVKNTRPLTRSLFFLCRNRDSDGLVSVSSRNLSSNKCSCGCSLHTKGDQELSAFLAEEIQNELKLNPSKDLPNLEGFECKLDGAEVLLTKKMDNEIITIRANVNNSVDTEDSVADPNEPKEMENPEMKSKPDFTIEIQKGNKVLSFMCTYAISDDGPAVQYDDIFQISEMAMHGGEYEDSTYSVSGDIMDGYLYDLLLNYLEERGISSQFVEKLITFFTSYEHKLYINFLQGMKTFIEK